MCKGSCRRTPTEGLTASRRTQAVLPHPTIENQLNHSLGFAIPPAWRCHAVPPFAQGGLFFALLFPLIWQRRHAATRGGCGEPPLAKLSLPCDTALGHPIISPCSLRQSAFNCRINKLTYTLKVPIDLIVGNPKYPQVIVLQKSSALGILFFPLAIIMLGTIQLNDQLGFGAVKIHNEFSQHLLSGKTNGIGTQKFIPKPPLFPCHFPAQTLCCRHQLFVMLGLHRPSPFKNGGEPLHPSSAAAPDHAAKLNHSPSFTIPPDRLRRSVPPLHKGGCGEPPHPSSAAAPDHAAKLNHSPSFTIPPDRLRRSVPPLHKGGFSLPCCSP